MTTDVIRLDQIQFRYQPEAKNVLEGISFSIQKGEVFGLLGPSGAGKSTTQKLLIGLLKGYRGQAEILGRSITDWGHDLYENIGVSFELPNHFPKLSARENLVYFSSLYKNAPYGVDEVLSWLGLEDAADMRVAGFSKGMKNRLSLARALIHRPDIIFLDEPTAGLDPVSTFKVQELVARLKSEGKTILINTHDMHIAESVCDRVAFIYQGKIAEIDQPNTLKMRYGESKVKVSNALGKREFPLQNLADNSEFFEFLKAGPVQTIHSSEASLDDVFRRVTGAKLDTETASMAPAS